ncbi:DUF4241 domain-containing protein [Streptomyces sp. A0592]|uniref:DUF4241 domain-containing protein n=1 Tax=Streptomyces sp. A0592 TaxID=2563099 RepID=UPI00109EB5A6|nr:DUF4241 domain-containing protein [Streptomyces sp. A0592]THA85603.1 DUF4241 domain-containing protein [Streptomyces sp. A0592]
MGREPGTVVEVGYAQGWDLTARAPWRPISAEEARERDAAGLPYVAEYRIPGREAPVEVRLVSWPDHHVGLWVYDEQGRRTHQADYRLLDGDRLLTRITRIWRYGGPEVAEFDAEAPRVTYTLHPDTRGIVSHEPRGSKGSRRDTLADVPDEEKWRDRPAFEDWPVISAQVEGLAEPVTLRAAATVADRDAEGAPAGLWRAPRPGTAGPMDALFRPGTRMTTPQHPDMTVVRPRRMGTLNVPSGLLAIDCPLDARGPRLTVAVPPGEHVLEEGQIAFGYHCMYDDRWVDTTEPTAVRLRVSEEPAVSWEMALAPEDDVRLLEDGHVYGFGTDGATGAFADAGAWVPLQERVHQVVDHTDQDGEDFTGSMFLLRTREPESGAELVAFAVCSDGCHPVWVGRSADGDVVGVVVVVDEMPDLADAS